MSFEGVKGQVNDNKSGKQRISDDRRIAWQRPISFRTGTSSSTVSRRVMLAIYHPQSLPNCTRTFIILIQINKRTRALPWDDALCLLSIDGTQIGDLSGFKLRQCRFASEGSKVRSIRTSIGYR
jgi:hypothetical protein